MNYWPEFTSTGRYTGAIGTEMQRSGADVEVITTPCHYPGWYCRQPAGNRYSREMLHEVRLYRCPLLLRRKMSGLWRLIAPFSFAMTSIPILTWRVFRRRPDVILCVEPTLFVAPATLMLARFLGIRTVLHVQDLEVETAFNVGHLERLRFLRRLAEGFERAVMRRFDTVVTISQAMQKKIEAKGVVPNRLTLIRNWVDVEQIHPLDGDNPYREELPIPPGAFVAQYAGNIGTKQALSVLLDAAAILRGRSDIVFIIAGEGPEKRSLQDRYGSLPNVRFLGLQPEERLNTFLNLADVHVIPQLAGTADLVLPSKLGGMLASGKPIIVTANEEDELGLFLGGAATLVPPGDARALAEAIEERVKMPAADGQKTRLALARSISSSVQLAKFKSVLTQHLHASSD